MFLCSFVLFLLLPLCLLFYFIFLTYILYLYLLAFFFFLFFLSFCVCLRMLCLVYLSVCLSFYKLFFQRTQNSKPGLENSSNPNEPRKYDRLLPRACLGECKQTDILAIGDVLLFIFCRAFFLAPRLVRVMVLVIRNPK